MKKILICTAVVLALSVFYWIGKSLPAPDSSSYNNEPAPDSSSNNKPAPNNNNNKDEKEPPPANAKLINTAWISRQEIGPSFAPDRLNIVKLTFYADSVVFEAPYAVPTVDVASLLGGISTRHEKYYSWDYSIEEQKIVLDPGFTGYAIPIEMSGDSLIWKGKLPVPLTCLSFKKVR